ncbi:TlpA family protein disulfide reductase [bacterium]|nr:TlpA family protein disulfide reductase [bacterium]
MRENPLTLRLVLIAMLALAVVFGADCSCGESAPDRDPDGPTDNEPDAPIPVAGDDDSESDGDENGDGQNDGDEQSSDDDSAADSGDVWNNEDFENSGSPDDYEVGDKNPDFTLPDRYGDPWNLYDHLGDVVVLNCSTFWCYYCKTEMETLQALADANNGRPVVVAQIIDEGSDGEPVGHHEFDNWVDFFQPTFAVLADPKSSVCGPAGNGSVPFYWLLDQSGIVQTRTNGLVTFQSRIDELLAK